MNNPYQKLKDNSILSMSQQELLLTCYDETLKNLKRADMALEDKAFESFDHSLEQVGRFVRYLTMTLNMEQPIAQDLKRLYEYVTFDIGRLKAGRERYKEELPALIDIFSELRSGFEMAGKEASASGIPADGSEVRVVG